MNNQEREEKGITLVALVITIIVLIILAGIAISMTLGDNGIFTRAKEAKRLQITAEAKEKIGADILDAQIEAVQKNETLQQSKVEEIISKYGELQADGDTIKLKDNGYEISLKEIYNGTTSSSGGSTGGSTGSAELNSLKAELAQTTATEDKILKDYKAYSNGKLMTGTMENYAGQTQDAIVTNDDTYTYLTIPNAGYYGTDSRLKTLNNNLSENEILDSDIVSGQSGKITKEIDISNKNKVCVIVYCSNYRTSFVNGATTLNIQGLNKETSEWENIETRLFDYSNSSVFFGNLVEKIDNSTRKYTKIRATESINTGVQGDSQLFITVIG